MKERKNNEKEEMRIKGVSESLRRKKCFLLRKEEGRGQKGFLRIKRKEYKLSQFLTKLYFKRGRVYSAGNA